MHEGSMNMECRLERSNHRAVFQNWDVCAIECLTKFSPCSACLALIGWELNFERKWNVQAGLQSMQNLRTYVMFLSAEGSASSYRLEASILDSVPHTNLSRNPGQKRQISCGKVEKGK
jgi:hypothetical protein